MSSDINEKLENKQLEQVSGGKKVQIIKTQRIFVGIETQELLKDNAKEAVCSNNALFDRSVPNYEDK